MSDWYQPLLGTNLARSQGLFRKLPHPSYPILNSWQGSIPSVKLYKYLLAAVKIPRQVKVNAAGEKVGFPPLAHFSVTYDILCLQSSQKDKSIQRLFEFQVNTSSRVANHLIDFLASCMKACQERDRFYLTESSYYTYWQDLTNIELRRLDARAELWHL
jgi:hypothetical protein